MDAEQASRLITEVDDRDHLQRRARLVELTHLLPDDEMFGFAGPAAHWLFEDVKATWLYGAFTGTVLTAHAFCLLQVASWIRLLPDDPRLPDEAQSLERLAAFGVEAGVLDVDLQPRLIELQDRYRAYAAANLHVHEARLERHLEEADSMTDEHPLLTGTRGPLSPRPYTRCVSAQPLRSDYGHSNDYRRESAVTRSRFATVSSDPLRHDERVSTSTSTARWSRPTPSTRKVVPSELPVRRGRIAW